MHSKFASGLAALRRSFFDATARLAYSMKAAAQSCKGQRTRRSRFPNDWLYDWLSSYELTIFTSAANILLQ